MEARIKTLGIDAIYFPVKDVQRSIAFYRDTVGVEPSGVSAGWGFGPAHRFGGNTSPATVGEIMDAAVCIMAFVNDAEGNILCLHQRKMGESTP